MTKSILQRKKQCYITGAERDLDLHHVYAGSRRKKSDQWGCTVWLRHDIHMDLHQKNTALDRKIKEECQRRFEELHGHDLFMAVFGKNYIKEGD